MFLKPEHLESLQCSEDFLSKLKEFYPEGVAITEEFCKEFAYKIPYNWFYLEVFTQEEQRKFEDLTLDAWNAYSKTMDIHEYDLARAQAFAQVAKESKFGES